jgi:hypothetical protein
MTLVLPAGASKPAPVMIMLGAGALPEAAGPSPPRTTAACRATRPDFRAAPIG